MNGLRISRDAQRDIDEIWDYIAADSPRAAEELSAEFAMNFERLRETPLLGQAREDLLTKLRFFPVGKYLIFYLTLSDQIEVLRVIHGARRYGSADF